MDRKEKQRRAQRYLLALARLERKCEEAARWESIAEGSAECEELTRQVQELRGDLMRAIGGMNNEKYREVLEALYLAGDSVEDFCRQKGWSRRYVVNLKAQALDMLEL